jgi:multidrug efflux pump subunit AcrA (membrane-fusion protein)
VRARPLVALAVGVAVVVVGLIAYSSHGSNASTRPLIVTAAVTRRTLQDQLTLTGTLGRVVQRTVTAGTATQISAVSVQDGATVKAGQSIIGINGRAMVAEPGSLPFFRSLTIGDSGPDAQQLDQILASDGFKPGPISTVFTDQTQAALAQWQAAHGYPGVTPAKPKTLTVSLQPSGAYKVGPLSAAGVVIDSSSGAAAPSASALPSAVGGTVVGTASRVPSALTGAGPNSSGAPSPVTSSQTVGSPGAGSADPVLASQMFADAASTTPGVAATPPTLTMYALNPVTSKGSPAVFVVYASSTSSAPVQFSVTEGGNAPANEVLPPAGPFAIPPGASSVEVQVPTRLNGLVQPDTQLTLQLASGSGYVVGSPGSAGTTIQSGDIPEINLKGGGTVVAGGTATFTITADQPPVTDTAVSLQVSGTAQPGQDFQPLTSTVLLRAGQTSVTVPVTTINSGVLFQPTDMITGSWPIRVGQVFVKSGDMVTPGAQLFTLTDAKFTVTLSASPSDRTQLKVGQRVTVQVQGGSNEAPGVISELDDFVTVDPTTKAQTYQGKISVGDLGAADGATVTIHVTVQAAVNALTVPIAAVKQDGLGRDVVRVLDLTRGGRVTEVPVRTGISDSSYMEIASGLAEGQVVIVETDNSPG